MQSHTVFISTPRGSGFRFTNERWGTDPAPPELPFYAIMDSSTVRPTIVVNERVRVRVRVLYSLSLCIQLLLSNSKEVERREIRNTKKEERNLPKGQGKGKG